MTNKMTNKLQIFNYSNRQVRTVTKDGEPWFVAKDVCEVLELSDVSMSVSRLDEDEKLIQKLFVSGQNRDITLISESGLYSLVLTSNKPEAKQFKRWITHEVIPSIRKHGIYATDELLNNPDLAIKAFTALKEERERVKLLQEKIEQDKSKVLFADSVSASNSTILIGEFAKILKQNGINIGQNRFFEYLRKNGYLISRKGTDYNAPTQYSMELGLFTVKETTITHADGHISINKTTKLSGKGQVYFTNKFLTKKDGEEMAV